MNLKVFRFLGVPFVTDEPRLIDWIDGPNLPKNHDQFERAFPGFIVCCHRAIREIEKDRLRVGRLEYLNGKIVAYPEQGFNHPPSEAFIFLIEEEEKNS